MTIDGFEDVPENDEAALKQAVAMQPVSVAICASGGLQFYTTGIVGGKCCDELDHGVLAVGYGVVRRSPLHQLFLFMCLNPSFNRVMCPIAGSCLAVSGHHVYIPRGGCCVCMLLQQL